MEKNENIKETKIKNDKKSTETIENIRNDK